MVSIRTSNRSRAAAVLSGSVDTTTSVEVGRGVGVRDSKAPSIELPLTSHQWTSFLELVVAIRR
ncbi:DUF397 domain-containing protein [Lentzea atacamensis]|uniref:DUF397 domain-containing protein n=1 Tax=Lentzea atacamensis TaxID=531938 RepID=UPI000D6B0832